MLNPSVRTRFESTGLSKSRCYSCGRTEYIYRAGTCSMCMHHGVPWWHYLLIALVALGFVAAILLPG